MNSSNRPGLVHRIDKDTSGLLVVAKTEEAMNHLAKQFFNKTSEREYVALVWGNLAQDEGTIIGHIGRHPKNRLQMTVFPDGSEGKEAITHYKVLERFGYVTLVSCRLETGRTHQIRAHFTYIDTHFSMMNAMVGIRYSREQLQLSISSLSKTVLSSSLVKRFMPKP